MRYTEDNMKKRNNGTIKRVDFEDYSTFEVVCKCGSDNTDHIHTGSIEKIDGFLQKMESFECHSCGFQDISSYIPLRCHWHIPEHKQCYNDASFDHNTDKTEIEGIEKKIGFCYLCTMHHKKFVNKGL